MRKTKIVCTLGPSVDDENILRDLIMKGMDVARMNFSHGSHSEHKKRADLFKKLRKELDRPIPLVLDTKGPEIRLGVFKEQEVLLEAGQQFVLTNDDIIGDKNKGSLTYKELHKDISIGTSILINDGLVELQVKEIKNKDIYCTVINSGYIGNKKGVNVPNTYLNLPFLTDKDIADIEFGIENDFDFIAVSFVRNADEIIRIKKLLKEKDAESIKIISKIENRTSVENIDEIIEVSDAIMVARGDLGVEIPVEEVPSVQKMIIDKCYTNGKPVIIATQMLDSMMRNPRPTRAETSDIANAIYDGTSAVMLSGETAAGKYPLESVETLIKVAKKTEESIDYWRNFLSKKYEFKFNITNAISYATCTTAFHLNANAIITVTESGNTARMISRFRPACPIIAATTKSKVQRQLSLSWGVKPYLITSAVNAEELFNTSVAKAIETGYVKKGDIVAVTGGVPIGISGTTNNLKVEIVE